MSGFLLNDHQSLLVFNLAMAGLLICGCGLAMGSFLKSAAAPLRHGVMLATLILMLASPWFTLLLAQSHLGWFRLVSPSPPVKPPSLEIASRNHPKPTTSERDEDFTEPPPQPSDEKPPPLSSSSAPSNEKAALSNGDRPSEKTGLVRFKPDPSLTETQPANETSSPRTFSNLRHRPTRADKEVQNPPTELSRQSSVAEATPREPQRGSILAVLASGFAWVWLAGVFVCFIRSIRAWRVVGRLKRSRRVVNDPRVLRLAKSAGQSFGQTITLRIYTSAQAPVPVSLGWWQGSIVMPEGLCDELSDSQLRDVFVHEAAHWARRDALVGLLGQLAWMLWWWNVPLYAVNRRLARLREQICDGHVLANGGDGREFAETLVCIAEWSVNQRSLPGIATTLLSGLEELTERMTHLTQGDQTMAVRLKRKTLVLLLLSAIGFGTLCSWPLLRAEDAPATKPKAAPAAPAESTKDQGEPQKHEAAKEKLQQEPQQERLERLLERLRNEKDEEVRNELLQEIQQEKFKRQEQRMQELKEERERNDRLNRLQAILNHLADRMAKHGTTGERLFGVFATLRAASSYPDPELFDYMRALTNWRSLLEREFPGKSDTLTPDEVAQLVKEGEAGELLKKYREAEKAYGELANKPPRTDWSAEAERWHQFASDFLSAGRGEELGKRWEKHIKNDPKHTSLYGLAYLEQIRLRKPGVVKKDVLRKFHSDDSQSPTSMMTRLILVMAAWDAAGLPREDKYRQSLWDDLLKLMNENEFSLRRVEYYRMVAIVFREFWQGLLTQDRTDFVNAMLEHQGGYIVRMFADLAGVPPAVRRRWFLTKTVEVEFIRTPFPDGLQYLMDAAKVPTIWKDPALAHWEKEINLDLKGRWLDVLDQFLAKTPFESVLLEDGTLWIGPPEKRKIIEKRHRELLAMAAQDSRLQEATTVEFINVPIRDCLNFLADVHDIWIKILGDLDRDILINLDFDAPLSLVLEVVAENSGAKWDRLGETIVLASEKDFPLWEKAIADYRRQQVTIARLQLAENPLGEKLQAPVDCEFQSTPLADVFQFLSEQNSVQIAMVDGDPQSRINLWTSRSSFAEVLSVMLAEHDLSWDTDGEVVLVADRETLSRFRELMSGRTGKRKNVPAAVERALAKDVATKQDASAKKTPADRSAVLDQIVQELSEQAGIKIDVNETVRQRWAKQSAWLPVEDVPLETVLDLIAVATEADWQITAEGRVQIESRKIPEVRAPADSSH